MRLRCAILLGVFLAACGPGGPGVDVAPAPRVPAPLPGDNYAYVYAQEMVVGHYDTRTARDDTTAGGVRELLAVAAAPNGSGVAVGYATAESTVVVGIRTGAPEVHRIYAGPSGASITLAWSRDATRLGVGVRGGQGGVFVLEADGMTRNVGCRAADGFEAWRSASEAIVHDEVNFYTVRVADCATLATFSRTGKSDIRFAPDGSRVSYFVDRDARFRNRADTEVIPELWIARNDGSGARKVADYQGRPRNARWSPDGRRIAYEVVSLRWANTLHLITYEVASESFSYIAEEKQLGVPSDFGLCWSPDSRRFAHDRIYARSTGAQAYTTRQVVVREGEVEQVVFDEVIDEPAATVAADRPARCRWADATHVLLDTRRGLRAIDVASGNVHEFPPAQNVLGVRVVRVEP
jgi:hypothetical protein